MTNTVLKAQIDSQITNETSPNSISPADVGGNLKAVVDYIDQFYVKEYIAQLSQTGTNAPMAQTLVKDKITLNLITDPIFRSISFFRDSVGTFRVRFTRKGDTTDFNLLSIMFGDRSARIISTDTGNTGGTEFWKQWTFKTIDDATGLAADGALTVNGGCYFKMTINNIE